jgi:hypothetical protein
MRKLQTLFFAVVLLGMTVSSLQAQSAGLSGSLETSGKNSFAKDPTKALLLAVFPGVLIHGYGHYYAKDTTIGSALLAGEVVGVAAFTLGAMMHSHPENFTDSWVGRNAANKGRSLELYGGLFFGLTWLADILHAPTVATEYNMEHGLQPVLTMSTSGNPELQVAYRF